MSQTYLTLVTTIGTQLLASATALKKQLKLSKMAVGDGNGTTPLPVASQTKLINEKYRAAVNNVTIDENNKNQIIIEQVIPESEGGWWIREIGVFDENNNLIAVGNCPPTYKPLLAEGSGRTQVIRMIIIVESTNSVEIKIDPSVVLATRSYVDESISTKIIDHEKSRKHPDATTTAKGLVQLNTATNSTSTTQAATPSAVKTAYDLANTANGTANTAKAAAETDATTSVKGRVQLNTATNSTSTTQAATPSAVKTAYDLANTANGTANTAKAAAETEATTSVKGRVQLNTATNSTSTTQAATPSAVKAAYDLADKALPKAGGAMTNSIISTYPDALRIKFGNQTAILRFDGSNFYILFTDRNNPDGGWNNLRPIKINSNDGLVSFDHDVMISGKKVLKYDDFGIGTIGAANKTSTPGLNTLRCGIYGNSSLDMDVNPVNDSGSHAGVLLNLSTSASTFKFQMFGACIGHKPKLFQRIVNTLGAGVFHEFITTDNITDYIPVGIPQPWPTSTPPSGWLKCNGATFDKTLYPKLAVTYPTGKLPDLRGEFIRGYDDGRGIDSGRNILSCQLQQVAAHKHVGGWGENISSASASNVERSAPFGATSEKGTWCGASGGDYDNALFYTNDATNGSITTSAGKTSWFDLNADGLIGTENRPRNIAFLYIVKAE